MTNTTTTDPEHARHVAIASSATVEELATEIDRRGERFRASHCSCGRPARQVLDGGIYGPTGYCGVPGMPPLDPCDCGQGCERHDRSVCHIYGTGMARSVGGRR